jgi:hypothetical protein
LVLGRAGVRRALGPVQHDEAKLQIH